ncbi:MAG: isochorismate synthase [Flavobacteriaceae bacterium]|nr:isochorismate synthase [Flavobacteriaceae bacterium]
MELAHFLDTMIGHYGKRLPFAVYSLPDSKTVYGVFQKNDTKHTTTTYCDKGVILAPFEYDREALCIPEHESEVMQVDYTLQPPAIKELPISENEKEHHHHLDLVNKALRTIRLRKAHKIVVARKKELSLSYFDIGELLTRLLPLYPTAYRYVWYHPDTGLWCGASPEVLLKTEDTAFTTMSLAGTYKIEHHNGDTPHWSAKEIAEQQLVTDAIATSLQKVTSVVKISKASTFRAGSLAHIRTDITGILKTGKATLETITAALHPTPAVCGTPAKVAKAFIKEHETYQRGYYTGFTGPVNQVEKSSSLFVNLRCMKIEGTRAHLYVGGGITAESDPELEWMETHNKLQTMGQVLQPML